MEETLIKNYHTVCQRIEQLRVMSKPQLLAVSKKHDASCIRTLFQSGQKRFGESYVQEALDKMEQLKDLAIEWHFIGPIQSNKTKALATHFNWVQSVDRLKILERLNRQRPDDLMPLKVLLQLKVGDEASKSGALIDDLYIMYNNAQNMPSIEVKGLMCIPPPSADFSVQCAYFNQARTVFDELHSQNAGFDVLSMGMSGDLEAAASCGSTMVRIGTDIFGAR